MFFYFLEGWLSIVLEVLESLHGLDEVLLEGQQVILLYALHRIFYVVTGNIFMMHFFLPLLRLGACHLRYELMDEVTLLVLAAGHFCLFLWFWWAHQVFVALCLLEDLGD